MDETEVDETEVDETEGDEDREVDSQVLALYTCLLCRFCASLHVELCMHITALYVACGLFHSELLTDH